jgi:hypothetical protein
MLFIEDIFVIFLVVHLNIQIGSLNSQGKPWYSHNTCKNVFICIWSIIYTIRIYMRVSYTIINFLFAQTSDVPHLVTVFILSTISSHGLLSANTYFLGQVQKLSTAASLTLYLNLVGLETYYWNYIAP